MGGKATKRTATGGPEAGSPTADELPERWSAQRKMELVLRLLRGEALDAVSRESQVPAHYLHRFQTLEEARAIIVQFIERYNDEWLIERLGYRTPAQARAEGWRAAA